MSLLVVKYRVVSGEIPRWEKELIFVAISKQRQCGYCVAAHIACCRMLGVDPESINLVERDLMLMPDTALREKIIFSLKCAREPRKMNASDYDKLRKHGITMSQSLELVAMAGLAVYANIMADATAMEPDEIFEAL